MGRKPRLFVKGRGRDVTIQTVGDWDEAPLDGLCESAQIAAALDKLQRDLVRRARHAGRTWDEIGASLGVSRQSAWERFP